MLTPRMAPQNPFHRHIRPLKNPPFLNGFYGIMGAGWLVAAFIGAQERRYQELVGPDGEDEELFQEGGEHEAKVGFVKEVLGENKKSPDHSGPRIQYLINHIKPTGAK